jgi:protein SCO1/2
VKLLVTFFFAFIGAANAHEASSAKPRELENVGFDQKLGAQVPLDLQFHTESGETVSLGKFFQSKPVILFMGYYNCPRLCPVVEEGLVKGLRTLSLKAGRDFAVVFVSVDPHETGQDAKLARDRMFTDSKHVPDGIFLLTGSQSAITALANSTGFRYSYDRESKQYLHAAGVVVLTPKGAVSRYLFGVEFSGRDLKLALVDASNQKIGTLVDRLLLYCFHYDPTQGKYGLAIIRGVRVGGAVTVACIGAFLLSSGLRRKRESV